MHFPIRLDVPRRERIMRRHENFWQRLRISTGNGEFQMAENTVWKCC